MRYVTQLGPIHFDSDLFNVFLQSLQEYSEVEKFEATAIWNEFDSKVTFDDASKLIEDGSIPNRLLSFDLYLRADKGTIKVRADSDKENFQLAVKGEEQWVKTNIQNITDLVESQGNELRYWLSHQNLFYLQLFVAGAFISNFLPDIWALINPIIHVPISTRSLLIGSGLLLLIGLLEIPKRIYPYVVLRRNGTEPVYKTIISVMIPVLSFIAAILSILSFLM